MHVKIVHFLLCFIFLTTWCSPSATGGHSSVTARCNYKHAQPRSHSLIIDLKNNVRVWWNSQVSNVSHQDVHREHNTKRSALCLWAYNSRCILTSENITQQIDLVLLACWYVLQSHLHVTLRASILVASYRNITSYVRQQGSPPDSSFFAHVELNQDAQTLLKMLSVRANLWYHGNMTTAVDRQNSWVCLRYWERREFLNRNI